MAKLESEMGRPATDEEVSDALGISVDAVNETYADVAHSAMLSLEDLLATCGDNLSDFACDPSNDSDPVFAAEMEERKRLLAEAISALPETEKMVVSLYYAEGLTLKEIAHILGVTESRVCQINSKAVVRLHGKLARHKEIMISRAA